MSIAFPTDHVEDAILVKAVLRGDNMAFNKLVHQNERLVYSIVFKMIEGAEDREDICQEVFLKAYDKLRTFKFESKLSTWIGNIAFNQSVNFLKKRKLLLLEDWNKPAGGNDESVESVEGIDLKDESLLPDELLIDKEKIKILLSAMKRLPVVQRTLLAMFHQEELSLEEISAITSLPVNTVKSHMFRGRKTLKIEMVKLLIG